MSAAKPFRVVLSSGKDWLAGSEIGGWILEPSWTLIRHALTPFLESRFFDKEPEGFFWDNLYSDMATGGEALGLVSRIG